MEKHEISIEDLERLAANMAQRIPDLECPECCDDGWVHQYVELSAQLYQDEWEWSCLALAFTQYRLTKNNGNSGIK
ncbi:hypothetical protein [Noviherbaspirillum saxi]|uniref:hypothetical protein n=1 Tax=Noviherbaspirillum saxi TaxID=2320863 RepID=UPI0011C3E80E|nr:hypothetical protein [Noviherbaspirillum saxi]